MAVKTTQFWDVTPCRSEGRYKYFAAAIFSVEEHSSALKTEVACSSKTSITSIELHSITFQIIVIRAKLSKCYIPLKLLK
jgi:hypothetical protein